MGKKVMMMAEVMFALMFVIIMVVIMGYVTTKGRNANTNLEYTLDITKLNSLNVETYNDTVLTGNDVLLAISNIESIGDNKMQIDVYLVANNAVDKSSSRKAVGNSYGFLKNNLDAKAVSYQNPEIGDSTYIDSQSNFHCYLIKSKNDVIIGIMFSEIKANSEIPCVKPYELKTDASGAKYGTYLLNASLNRCGSGDRNKIVGPTL